MAKPFRDLLARLPQARQRRIARRAEAMLAALELSDLRRARRHSQQALAAALDSTQSSISKLESRTDTTISTLRDYIEALGGQLHLIAHFPDGDIRITQFDPPKRR